MSDLEEAIREVLKDAKIYHFDSFRLYGGDVHYQIIFTDYKKNKGQLELPFEDYNKKK